MLKTYKINKRDYTNFEYLLKRVGAVHNDQGFPSHVYWSKADLNKSRAAIKASYKKEFPYMTSKALDYQVGMLMLNLSPSEVAGNGLKPGYMLVDERAIKDEKRSNEE
jgi:hypothetical protein